jgi:hypothetical protein
MLCLVVGTVACGASDEASDSAPLPYGGQTGSLVPRCEFARPDLSAEAPSGDNVLVVYGSACERPIAADSVELTSEDGETIPVALVDIGSGATLIRTSQVLQPGIYTVDVPGIGSTSVKVGEPQDLPVRLGALRQIDSGICEARFDLELDEALLPYTALLKLDVRIDNGNARTLVNFGRLSADGRHARFSLGRCFDGCMSSGVHRITLSATIAGETLQPEPLEDTFVMHCPSLDSGERCSITHPRGGAGGAGAAALLLALAASLTLRRETRLR